MNHAGTKQMETGQAPLAQARTPRLPGQFAARTLRGARRWATGLLLAGLVAGAASANTGGDEHAGDWESPEAIVHALYETISADAGATRDWDRFRALFIDGARLSVAVDSGIGSGIMGMDVEELIAQTDSAYAATGFHEIPLAMRVERHGGLASVTSSFEVRLRRSDAKPLLRGLNHFQLLHDGERWWILSNAGVMETPSTPLPEALLPGPVAAGG